MNTLCTSICLLLRMICCPEYAALIVDSPLAIAMACLPSSELKPSQLAENGTLASTPLYVYRSRLTLATSLGRRPHGAVRRANSRVVRVVAPGDAVELDLVVEDLGASGGRVDQVDALDFARGSWVAEPGGDPVPNNGGAVEEDIEGLHSGDGWCVHHVVDVHLLASEGYRAELLCISKSWSTLGMKG